MKKWVFPALFVACFVGLMVSLSAQTIGIFNLSGNECWNAGQGAGGTTVGFVCTNVMRNTTGYQLLSSASGTIQPTNAVDNLLVNAQPAASTTINTPLNPFDGELFAICNVTGSAWATNTVTLAAGSGSLGTGTITALTTLAAHTCEELQYTLAATTWYQVR